MDILPWHFRTFQIFGLYHENSTSFWLLKLLHKIITLSLTFHFALLQFINLITMREFDIDAFTASLFLTLTYIAASFKQINFALDREKITALINQFRRGITQADNVEIKILANYDSLTKRIFVIRMITTGASGAAFLIVALLNLNTDNLELPFSSYRMFDISNPVSYAIAYFLQLATTITTISTDVTLDSVACAFIVLTCAQLDLLTERIATSKKTNSPEFASYCVEHHNLIFGMVNQLQSCFMTVMMPAFVSALIALCSSIFQLAQVCFFFFNLYVFVNVNYTIFFSLTIAK